MIPTVTAVDLPAALRSFRRRYPAVQIRLRDGASDAFVRAIAEGRMDVALLGLPDSVTVTHARTAVLARERLVAVLGAGHRLAHRRRLNLRDIAEEIFVDFPVESPGRLQSDEAFEAAGLRREVSFEAMNVTLMLFADYVAVENGADVTDTMVISDLPEVFREHYDWRFVRRLIVVAVDLTGRITAGWRNPSCLAEELLLRLMLNEVEVFPDIYDVDFPHGWRADLDQSLFEDNDYELLYSPELDGYVTSGALEALGINHEPSAWFTPSMVGIPQPPFLQQPG